VIGKSSSGTIAEDAFKRRNENGSERSKFAAFHTPILAPEVIAREIPFNLAAAL
jgi:hypothetical protein